VNAYLAELKMHPEMKLPGEYAQLPVQLLATDIPDWRPQDSLALARLQQFQLSETLNEESGYGAFASVYGPGGALADPGKMNVWIRAAAPPTEQTHTLVELKAQARINGQGRSPLPGISLEPWSNALQRPIASSPSCARSSIRSTDRTDRTTGRR